MFTSIPLTETPDLVVDKIFEKNLVFKISEPDIKKLFQFANSGTYFMFEVKFYNQINGVAMTSPLDPVLVNPFMEYFEHKWLQSFEECKVIIYRRYMDDIICLFDSESDPDKFFIFRNQQHPNIKLTIRKQMHNQVSFLDYSLLIRETSF